MTTVLDGTIAATRQAITGLLGRYEQLTGYAHRPDTLHAGAAWPVKRESTYETLSGCVARTEWEVVVLLPVGSNGAPVAEADDLEARIAADLHSAGMSVQTSGPSPQLSAEYSLPALGFRIETATY